MGLNRKTELIFLSSVIILVCLAYWIQERVVMKSFNDLELVQAKKDMERCVDAIQREISEIEATMIDWAYWDDTYTFVKDHNEEYIKSNLSADSLHEVTKVDFGAILDDDGKVIWQSVKDRNSGEHVQLSEFPADIWPKNHPVLQSKGDKPFSGILLTSHGPMILAASKVTNTNKTEPYIGTLVIGTFFNDKTIQALVRQTHVEFIAWPALAEVVPREDAVMLIRLKMGESIVRENEDSRLLDVYQAYPGPRDEPVLLLRARIPRDIGIHGQEAVRLSLILLIAMSLGLLLMLGVFMRWAVLTPIAKLTQHVTHLGQAGNLSLRVDADRNDELGILATEFNNMMDRIEKNHHKLEILTAELEQLSRHDALTGLLNRRQFDENLEREIRRAARTGSALSLIMVDVDYFKKYNDHYGHVQGDEVLRKVSSVLSDNARRAADSVTRYGGEEFAIILPNTTREKAEQVAKNMCAAISRLEMPHLASTAAQYVTASFGVAGMTPMKDTRPDELVTISDAALYQAKHDGRNRVHVAAA